MPKLQVKSGPYARLLKLAAGNGSHSSIGTAIGNMDPAVIRFYLDHMKANDPPLWKKWGSKYRPLAEEEDDDFDPTAEDDDDPTAGEEDTAGLQELFGREEEEPASVASPPPESKAAVKRDTSSAPSGVNPDRTVEKAGKTIIAPVGHHIVDGVAYPPVFKFRGPDGLTVELEVMSKNPQWGFMLRHPVPSDPRTFLLGGAEVTVDLLALKRDPDGMTTLNGKKYTNSRLVVYAELATDD